MGKIKSEITHEQEISITHDPPIGKVIKRIKRNLRKIETRLNRLERHDKVESHINIKELLEKEDGRWD